MAVNNRKAKTKVVEEPPIHLAVSGTASEEAVSSLTEIVSQAKAESLQTTTEEAIQHNRLGDDLNFQAIQRQLSEQPLIILVAIVAFPAAIFLTTQLKFVLLPVMLVVLSTFAYQELRRFIPFVVRDKFEKWIGSCSFLRKFGLPFYNGVREIRPFLLAAVFFYSGLIITFFMIASSIKRMLKKETYKRADLFSPDRIIIEQSVSKPIKDEEDANFYLSPAFTITLLSIFALGLPAALTIVAYYSLGVDALFGYPSRDPEFFKIIFLIGFYISSLGWCMTSLFFRAWFTYPMNFYSNAYDVVLDENGIDKKNIKGWFAELIWFCYPEYLPTKIEWKELHEVKFSEGGFGRLYPLPDTLFSKESILYKLFNRVAAFTDAIVDRVGRCDYIEFRTAGAVAKSIKLRLWQMNKEDRARVFYAVRKWSPAIVVPEKVQHELLGSSVLAEARYPQIWFDILTSNSDRQRRDLLEQGDCVKNGELEVINKIDSGGQANVYLAKRKSGESVVLKEFILTGDEDMSSLMESAADFENEGSILARLDHPQVVKLHDVFTEDRRVYLVLEHVQGQSLRHLIAEQGPLSEEQAIKLGLEMCKILRYLHDIVPPILHRDFTPDNLMLMPDGRLKVIDFSVAGSSVNVKDGDCVGKHSYTPAEQFRGQPCPQSDLYALGATLYFLTVGSDPPPITQLHPADKDKKLSAGFDAIVSKLTSNTLAERYETAAWLEVELSALLENSYIIV